MPAARREKRGRPASARFSATDASRHRPSSRRSSVTNARPRAIRPPGRPSRAPSRRIAPAAGDRARRSLGPAPIVRRPSARTCRRPLGGARSADARGMPGLATSRSSSTVDRRPAAERRQDRAAGPRVRPSAARASDRELGRRCRLRRRLRLGGPPRDRTGAARRRARGRCRRPTAPGAQPADEPVQAIALSRAERRRRLVQDQEPRLGAERPSDLDELALANREAATGTVVARSRRPSPAGPRRRRAGVRRSIHGRQPATRKAGNSRFSAIVRFRKQRELLMHGRDPRLPCVGRRAPARTHVRRRPSTRRRAGCRRPGCSSASTCPRRSRRRARGLRPPRSPGRSLGGPARGRSSCGSPRARRARPWTCGQRRYALPASRRAAIAATRISSPLTIVMAESERFSSVRPLPSTARNSTPTAVPPHVPRPPDETRAADDGGADDVEQQLPAVCWRRRLEAVR